MKKTRNSDFWDENGLKEVPKRTQKYALRKVEGIPHLYARESKDGKDIFTVKVTQNGITRKKVVDIDGLTTKRANEKILLLAAQLKDEIEQENKKKNSPTERDMEYWLNLYCDARIRGVNPERRRMTVFQQMEGYTIDDEEKNISLAREAVSNGMRYRLTLVSAVFSFIQKSGVAVRNPLSVVKLPTAKHRTRIFTPEEIRRLEELLAREKDRELYLFARILIYTGARCSTAYAVKASDVKHGGIQLYNVKARRPYTVLIPLPEELREDLLRFRGWEKTQITLERKLQKRVDKLFNTDKGEERAVVHTLRHTFASTAIQNGISLEIISKCLDHASINVTLQTYAKFAQSQIDSAVSCVKDVYEKKMP